MAGSFESWQKFCRAVLGDRYRSTESPQEPAAASESREKRAEGKTPAGAPKAADGAHRGE